MHATPSCIISIDARTSRGVLEFISLRMLFWVILAALLVAVLNSLVNPHPFQTAATTYARHHGWSMPMILLTRASCYLTLWTQALVLLALQRESTETWFVAETATWVVFSLYHVINYLDVSLLSHHDLALTQAVVRWLPPTTGLRHLVIWAGLHLQHTVLPFYMATHRPGAYQPRLLVSGYITMCAYILWHTFCWGVQGVPAYPLLHILRARDLEFHFYATCCVLVMIIESALVYF